jgi:hypothetical protein
MQGNSCSSRLAATAAGRKLSAACALGVAAAVLALVLSLLLLLPLFGGDAAQDDCWAWPCSNVQLQMKQRQQRNNICKTAPTGACTSTEVHAMPSAVQAVNMHCYQHC